VDWSGVEVLGTGCLSLLKDIQTIWSFTVSFIFFWFFFLSRMYGCAFCMLLFNFLYCVFLLLCLCILIVMYFPFQVLCFILLFCVLFVCKCVPYYCHRVSTQLQVANISYHILSHIISYIMSCSIISYLIIYHIMSCHVIYHIISYHILSYHIIYITSHHIRYNPTCSQSRLWTSELEKQNETQ
jgi:hypothetical protein